MAFNPITAGEINAAHVEAAPDKLTGTAADNKRIFDAYPDLIKNKYNETVGKLNSTTDGSSGADNVGTTPVGEGTADSVQGVLEELNLRLTGADRITLLLAAINTIGAVANDEHRLCTAKDIVDYISAIGGGDMLKAAYDSTNTGNKVDTALNAEKLGGQLPSYFASASSVAAAKAFADNPDTIPTLNSQKGVTSDGVRRAINTAVDKPGASSAGAHNAIYRGKYLGSSVTAEQYAQIAAGTFEDMYIGDYWTISGINWRIADFDYYYRSGYDPDNADGHWGEVLTHHVVIVPDRSVGDYQKMNSTDTTAGGYIGSEMRTTNMTAAKNLIKAAFGESHIMVHKDHLVNAVYNGYPSGGAWVDTDIELMTEWMVYGAPVFHPMCDGSRIVFNYEVGCKQLNLFRHRPDLIYSDAWRFDYWLRDVVSAAYFALVSYYGSAACYAASFAYGVRPAFCLIS